MSKLLLVENKISVGIDWGEGRFPIKSVSICLIDRVYKEILPSKKTEKTIFFEIRSFLNGETGKLPIDLLDLKTLSPFAQEILLGLRDSVPIGNTVSYARLAEITGHPGAARAVGSVLRNNPFPLFFPCHRVIRSNGDIGFFQGSRKGASLKQYLLNIEKDK